MCQTVAILAAAARLPLTADRIAIVAEILGEWTPGCHELNAVMSAADRVEVVPITVLAHPS
jgi:hypothetical protein